MRYRLMPLLVLAAALSLAGCGGASTASRTSTSGAGTTTGVALAERPATPTTTTAQSARRSTPKARTRTTSAKRAAHASSHVAAHAPAHAPSQPSTPARPLAVTSTGKVSGPGPLACLRQAGLLNPHEVSQGENVALSAAIGEDVFVDGPYKNKNSAASAAVSLQGIEDVQAASLYVVSAKLSAHLHAKIKAVAACLNGARGHGFLKF
jgi:predicted small secreted protein